LRIAYPREPMTPIPSHVEAPLPDHRTASLRLLPDGENLSGFERPAASLRERSCPPTLVRGRSAHVLSKGAIRSTPNWDSQMRLSCARPPCPDCCPGTLEGRGDFRWMLPPPCRVVAIQDRGSSGVPGKPTWLGSFWWRRVPEHTFLYLRAHAEHDDKVRREKRPARERKEKTLM
jgi:hypothetical protein